VTAVARLGVFQLDRGAEHDAAVGVERLRIDDLRVGQLAFQVGNAAFDEALLFLGGVVFGVLRQVALRTRLGDRLDHGGPLHGFQMLQLGAQFFCAHDGEGEFVHTANLFFQCRR
jgi:hypothetical protein